MTVENTQSTPDIPDVSIGDGSSKTEACTIMKLSKGNSNEEKYIFESETVIKNGKYGIVVWLETNNIKNDNLRYQVYLLEKSNSSWIFKHGFISKKIDDNVPTAIESPDEPKTINVTYEKVASDYSGGFSANTTKYYSGIWKENNAGDEKSLFNASFKFIKEQNFFVSDLNNATNFLASYIYKENNKLLKYNNAVNRTASLVKWFKPFENKKGKWNNLKDYCKTKSLTRNISEETKNFLKTYCYKY